MPPILNKDKICAVIVTYNRRELLRRCLLSLLAQTRPLDKIIVVDNASSDGSSQMIYEEFPSLACVELHENFGGAVGFRQGMKLAYEQGCDWIWIMDDDARASNDCLMRLLERSTQADVLKPIQIDSAGRIYGQGYWRGRYVSAACKQSEESIISIELFSFVGPLINRSVIETVGFPRGDFFVSGDDYEYGFRIRSAGFKCIAVLDAVIYHDLGGKPIMKQRFGIAKMRYPQEDWKQYYDARNNLIILQQLKNWERWYSYSWYLYLLMRSAVSDLLYESHWRKRLQYRWLGVLHGIRGFTGKRVEPDGLVEKQ